MSSAKPSAIYLKLLSRLLLARRGEGAEAVARDSAEAAAVTSLGSHEFADLWTLATSHHVILRAFPGLYQVLAAQGNGKAVWIDQAIAKEQDRVHHALQFLSPICEALGQAGKVIVIKSLDHWPDLGSDLDLYSSAKPDDVVAIMRSRFKARTAARSWGDRLANKWNFIVPGLPELVEVHVGRLGQTGEQISITESLVSRGRTAEFASHTLPVASPEDRMIISTLQRMYRHFYVRLCDIADNAALVDSGAVDYQYLQALAESAGLWSGLATYLTIVSGYVETYRGAGLALPALVTDAARFGNERVHFRRNFLRIPLFPYSARLYASEWKRLLLNGEIQNALRLSLLPGLATAAALELKLTGSDKGIW